MGIFSKQPSMTKSVGYALAAFAMNILRLDEDVRGRVSPVTLAAVKYFVSQQDLPPPTKEDAVIMFQVLSGTVGVEPSPPLDAYGKANDIRDVIEESIPFEMPLVVMGPIRMVIEEYVTGQDMNDIDYERFDKSDARKVINALMDAVKTVNSDCIQEPKKHTTNEVLFIAALAAIVSEQIKNQLMS